jgi:hypothetical protein
MRNSRHELIAQLAVGAFCYLTTFNSLQANEDSYVHAIRSTDASSRLVRQLLAPPALRCPNAAPIDPGRVSVKFTDLTTSERLLLAARTTMAVQYQSCAAPFVTPAHPLHETLGRLEVQNPANASLVIRSITDIKEYEATHPVISQLPLEANPECRDISLAPPMYLYGAKPLLSRGPPPIADLFVDQSRASVCMQPNGQGFNGAACPVGTSPAVTGMDCSGFFSIIFRNSGLRVTRDSTPGLLNTSQLVSAARSRSSCLDSINWNAATSTTELLAPGDIYVVSSQHLVMVESTGSDPFGLDRLPADQSCDALTPADWDFRIIHSSSRGGAAGISRMNASEFFLEAAEFAGPLIAQAQELCRSRRASRMPPDGSPLTRARVEHEQDITPDSFTLPRSAMFIRHRGASARGCETPPKDRLTLAGDQCIAGCNLLPERE